MVSASASGRASIEPAELRRAATAPRVPARSGNMAGAHPFARRRDADPAAARRPTEGLPDKPRIGRDHNHT
jgi:hypothetical protein